MIFSIVLDSFFVKEVVVEFVVLINNVSLEVVFTSSKKVLDFRLLDVSE